MNHYGLIVVGGGFAGVAAAVAAAREGTDVLLVERYGFLGGAAAACQVNPFMRYHMESRDEKGNIVCEPLCAGIFSTILGGLDELGGLLENRATFNEESLKLLFDRMLRGAGVDVLFHSYLSGVHTEGSKVKSITVVNKSGTLELEADYYLDTTGDADLAALAGCAFHLGREEDSLCQPMTLCFRIGNIDMEKFHRVKATINALYQKYQSEGRIQNPREDVLTFPHVSEGVVHFNSTRIIKRNPLDCCDLSTAEMDAREQVYELYQFFKNHIDGFQNSTLLMSAPQIGVRESRMIEGEYTITADDILHCTKFEDSIACGNYMIDIHSPDGAGTIRRSIPKDDYYTIPYRALIPKGMDNLLVAGRCISSTHEAQSAYRILPICCCMGEAAGIALGLAANDSLRMIEVPISTLHEKMDAYGARY